MPVVNNASEVINKRKNKRASFASRIGMIALIAFIVYAVIVIIQTEVEMNEQQAVLEDLKEQITAATQENDEYERILGGEDENAYMEMIAIEQYGYAYPNEKRFYIKESTSSDDTTSSEESDE